jgi:hypothetical protein
MRFNVHSELEGRHAFLSPSYYHWLNYDDQKLTSRFYSVTGAKRGTDLHALANEAIRLGVRLDESNDAMASYVNDAIDLGMSPEQPLFYSENCFGTADAILFEDNVLRVHDLKTGITATSEKQLEVYAALFCLEYGVSPFDIEIELRIYQREEVRIFTPYPEGILAIMDKIIEFDQHIERLKEDNRANY